MLLFAEDWNKEISVEVAGLGQAWLRPVVHYDTANKSFIKQAMVLRKMGIANYNWHLALYQPELANYDPHDLKDSSTELRQRIALECKINPAYFFREVVRIPTAGGDPVPFGAHRGNLSMIWCFYNFISYIAIWPRQQGKTFTACTIDVHTMYIAGRNIEILLYTKDAELVQTNVNRIKSIRNALPKYLIHEQVADVENKEGLSYEKLQNKYRTAVASADKLRADIIGRGATVPRILFDEPGFCTNIDITYPIMMFATLAAVANAKARGQPHSNILTTTAAPIDTARGRFTFNLVNKAMPFTEKLYDLQNHEALKSIVRTNSANGLMNGTYSYLMLGKTREWFEEACRIGEATKEVNDRELLNMWISGSELSILDPATISILNAHRHEPNHTEFIHDYVVKWYVTETFRTSSAFLQRKYILGMDSSENIGEDFTTLVMIDVTDMSVVCTFRCNETNTVKLGMFIAEFLVKYPNVTFIPEHKSTGGAIIDAVTLGLRQNRINPFRRIFSEIVQKRADPKFAHISLDAPDLADTSAKRYLGFCTTGQTRPYLYKNTLKKAASLNATRVHDVTLISELSALATKNGRIDHTEGGHDDMVIAWLLGCWMIFFGENLQYYGIDVRSILMSVTADGGTIDPLHRARQLDLRRQIKYYDDLIALTPSPILKNMYRQKILLLQDQLDHTVTVEPIAVSKITHDADEYGNTLYTPQEFARTATAMRGMDDNVRRVINFL
jgi:hypothetical protein